MTRSATVALPSKHCYSTVDSSSCTASAMVTFLKQGHGVSDDWSLRPFRWLSRFFFFSLKRRCYVLPGQLVAQNMQW